jgi:hypothetical protein
MRIFFSAANVSAKGLIAVETHPFVENLLAHISPQQTYESTICRDIGKETTRGVSVPKNPSRSESSEAGSSPGLKADIE